MERTGSDCNAKRMYRKPGREDEMQVGRHGSEEIKPGLMRKLLKQIEDN